MDNEKEKAIGVFDSGVGGLTVFRELMKQMPRERLIFFGDTARVPYGSKSKETVTRYSEQIIRFLRTQNVKAIVAACNTASALALDDIEKNADFPIIGVVKPGAYAASQATKNGKIGLIGTEATISSGMYERLLKDINPDARIIGKACPLFVPLVEEGLLDDPVTTEIAGRYLAGLIDSGIDTLIMGCTHYPLIKDTLQKTVGDAVKLINPAYETARECSLMLEEKGLLNDKDIELGETAYRFFVSDEAEKFKSIANMILPLGILGAKKIAIEDY
ncbi:MAG: glutamate racemase [Lachnospiraceae bacterium]|nr:glutamate racemase [Lachnospiraceae bacterium]MBR1876258.1 glutamate racemase [Lachnospiraceae bacterium]